MKKTFSLLYVALLATFAGVFVANRPAAASATLGAAGCSETSGDWFCFYHNGTAYYRNFEPCSDGSKVCRTQTPGVKETVAAETSETE
jgi:hypothetical protein